MAGTVSEVVPRPLPPQQPSPPPPSLANARPPYRAVNRPPRLVPPQSQAGPAALSACPYPPRTHSVSAAVQERPKKKRAAPPHPTPPPPTKTHIYEGRQGKHQRQRHPVSSNDGRGRQPKGGSERQQLDPCWREAPMAGWRPPDTLHPRTPPGRFPSLQIEGLPMARRQCPASATPQQ